MGHAPKNVAAVCDLLKPYDAQSMPSYPISSRVNYVGNDHEEGLRPFDVVAKTKQLFAFSKERGNMDAKKLVVGQQVHIISGNFGRTGKVVKIWGHNGALNVQTGEQRTDGTWTGELMRFTSEGEDCGPGTEFGACEILDDAAFEEYKKK